jgi:hypothetical protein
MCVYKNHAFICFSRPPSWSGTLTSEHCQLQRWFRIFSVRYSADKESVVKNTALTLNEGCIIQRSFGIRAVSDRADSESSLYQTVLFQNPRRRIQRWSWIALYNTLVIHRYCTDSIFKSKTDGKHSELKKLKKFSLIIYIVSLNKNSKNY